MPCNDLATLPHFCWTGNELLQDLILHTLPAKTELLFYIWGSSGSGKSHLLQAVCQHMAQQGHTIAYLPLKLLKNWGPAILEGMADHALVAVDDIEQVAGLGAWEEELFHLYNRLQAQHHTLIISGSAPPILTAVHLADLRSRLTHALIVQLHELSDEAKLHTLQDYAKNRGLDLPKQVGRFILRRCDRNMHDLQVLLQRLDHASMVAQRKLTIPFVKDVLGF